MPDRFGEYLSEAAAQIRWRQARSALTRELADHLAEQKEANLAAGMEDEAAETEAVRQMGDPVLVGQALDRVHRPKPQWGLLTLTLALFLAGALLRFYLRTGFFSEDAVAEQLPKISAAAIVGLAALFGGYLLDISFVGKHAVRIYLSVLAISFLLLWRSARIGGVPYYLGQLTAVYPVVYAMVVYALRGRGWAGYVLSLLAGVPLAWLSLAAVNIPSLVVLLATGVVLMLLCSRRGWFHTGSRGTVWVTAALAVLCAGCVLYFLWQTGVLDTALHPERDPHGMGYTGVAVRDMVRASRWWGHGEEIPVPRFLVMELSGDFFPLNILYLLGRWPLLLLNAALAALLVWGLAKAIRQESFLGRIVSLAVVLAIGQQFLWGLLSNLGFILFSTSMPLVTGHINSALDMAMLGLLLSCFRCETLPETDARHAKRDRAASPRIRWDDGILTINLRLTDTTK